MKYTPYILLTICVISIILEASFGNAAPFGNEKYIDKSFGSNRKPASINEIIKLILTGDTFLESDEKQDYEDETIDQEIDKPVLEYLPNYNKKPKRFVKNEKTRSCGNAAPSKKNIDISFGSDGADEKQVYTEETIDMKMHKNVLEQSTNHNIKPKRFVENEKTRSFWNEDPSEKYIDKVFGSNRKPYFIDEIVNQALHELFPTGETLFDSDEKQVYEVESIGQEMHKPVVVQSTNYHLKPTRFVENEETRSFEDAAPIQKYTDTSIGADQKQAFQEEIQNKNSNQSTSFQPHCHHANDIGANKKQTYDKKTQNQDMNQLTVNSLDNLRAHKKESTDKETQKPASENEFIRQEMKNIIEKLTNSNIMDNVPDIYE